MSCTGSAATATLSVHAGENLGVIKYERWKRRQGSIVAPMATKPTLPDGMCLPTGKPAQGVRIYLVAYQVDQARSGATCGDLAGR